MLLQSHVVGRYPTTIANMFIISLSVTCRHVYNCLTVYSLYQHNTSFVGPTPVSAISLVLMFRYCNVIYSRLPPPASNTGWQSNIYTHTIISSLVFVLNSYTRKPQQPALRLVRVVQHRRQRLNTAHAPQIASTLGAEVEPTKMDTYMLHASFELVCDATRCRTRGSRLT